MLFYILIDIRSLHQVVVIKITFTAFFRSFWNFISIFFLDHDCVKELLHIVGVPLVYRKCLRHIFIIIKQLDNGIGSPDILDSQARIPRGSVALDERLDLRVSSQPSSADLQDSFLILDPL